MLVLEVHGLRSLARAAHGSSSSSRIPSFESNFLTRPFFHQNESEELGGKLQPHGGVDGHRAAGMGSRGRWVASVVRCAALAASRPCWWALSSFDPLSSFLGRDLAKFNKSIKSKISKRDKARTRTSWCLISPRSWVLLQPAIWFHNIDAAASPAGGGIFCFLPGVAVAAAQFSPISQIYQYSQSHRVKSQFQAARIQIPGPKSQIGQHICLAGLCSSASQQLAKHEFAWAWQASQYHFCPQDFYLISFIFWKLALSFGRRAPQLAAAAPQSGRRGSVEASGSSLCQLVRSRALCWYCLQTLHSLSQNSYF